MRRALLVWWCLVGFWAGPALAEESASTSDTLDALYVQLTEASLRETQAILERLRAEGDEAVILPLFKTLLAGDLHYRRSDNRLMIETQVNGEGHYIDYFTGEDYGELGRRDQSKIRVNNNLRGYLTEAIARMQLSHEDAKVREAAVRSLLADLDDNTATILAEARATETHRKVRQALDLALAMHTAEHGDNSADRITAIQELAGSLETDVRNLLFQLAQNDSAEGVKAAARDALKEIDQSVTFYGYVDQLFFGLSLGSVLLLAAIGLAITFGVMGVINMAHGEMLMLGAYTTYVVQLMMPNMINYSLWVAIPAAFLVSGAVGVLIERCVIRFLHGRPLETLLATFGISLILQQLVRTVFSPLNRRVAAPDWMSGSWEINPVLSLTYNRLTILIFALIVFVALLLIMKKTTLGLQVRAVSQNRAMAKAMGIKTDWVDALTFGLGSGIAGIGGVALSQLTNVGPNLGQAYIIDSFMVVVFGGVGNLFGTLVAAFSLGIANKFMEPVTGTVLASILVLVFIILFIQKRPKGLFPQRGRAAE